MNLRAFCQSRCSQCHSSYCKGELLVGIIILDSILLIKGSVHRQGETSPLIQKCTELHTRISKNPTDPVQDWSLLYNILEYFPWYHFMTLKHLSSYKCTRRKQNKCSGNNKIEPMWNISLDTYLTTSSYPLFSLSLRGDSVCSVTATGSGNVTNSSSYTNRAADICRAMKQKIIPPPTEL